MEIKRYLTRGFWIEIGIIAIIPLFYYFFASFIMIDRIPSRISEYWIAFSPILFWWLIPIFTMGISRFLLQKYFNLSKLSDFFIITLPLSIPQIITSIIYSILLLIKIFSTQIANYMIGHLGLIYLTTSVILGFFGSIYMLIVYIIKKIKMKREKGDIQKETANKLPKIIALIGFIIVLIGNGFYIEYFSIYFIGIFLHLFWGTEYITLPSKIAGLIMLKMSLPILITGGILILLIGIFCFIKYKDKLNRVLIYLSYYFLLVGILGSWLLRTLNFD